jgi:ectoine hydroxylase-related dioxygenase (phytanoyl-CoA dioxygenase family)
VNDDERYLFDLMGYLVVEDVLTAAELRELNELIDRKDVWARYEREQSANPTRAFNYHVGPLHTWEEPFRRLIGQPKIVPYLGEMIGPGYRYDHGYAIFMKQGGEQHRLHGGGTPYEPEECYHWRNGRMYNGLVVVSYALGDVGPGDGGFAAVPGSHKANLPCPERIKEFERTGPWLIQVPQPAGSAIIFTEALTHGTWTWMAERERRSLLYKYSPGHQSWSRTYPSAADVPDAAWEEHTRRMLEAPYVQGRASVTGGTL